MSVCRKLRVCTCDRPSRTSMATWATSTSRKTSPQRLAVSSVTPSKYCRGRRGVNRAEQHGGEALCIDVFFCSTPITARWEVCQEDQTIIGFPVLFSTACRDLYLHAKEEGFILPIPLTQPVLMQKRVRMPRIDTTLSGDRRVKNNGQSTATRHANDARTLNPKPLNT